MDVAVIIESLFDVVGAVLTGLGTSFTAVFGLLWDAAGTPAGLTDLGTIVIVIIAAPLAFSLLTYVISLFKGIRVKGGKR